jgi:hypothetical protein
MGRLASLLRFALLASLAARPHLVREEVGSWRSPAVRAQEPTLLPTSRAPGVVRLPDGASSGGLAVLPLPVSLPGSARHAGFDSPRWRSSSPRSARSGCPRFPTGPPSALSPA